MAAKVSARTVREAFIEARASARRGLSRPAPAAAKAKAARAAIEPTPIPEPAETMFRRLRIPRRSAPGCRFDVGHRSDLIPATIPK